MSVSGTVENVRIFLMALMTIPYPDDYTSFFHSSVSKNTHQKLIIHDQ